jgi:hypothetical protein
MTRNSKKKQRPRRSRRKQRRKAKKIKAGGKDSYFSSGIGNCIEISIF